VEIQMKDFAHPDEQRPFEGKGWTDIVTVADHPVAYGHYEPGWRWSVNVKPIAGTDLCEYEHLIYCLAGHLRIHLPDGTSRDITPGTVAAIPPGHDAEVVGDEACAALDFGNIAGYAQRG
jgi:hypothetical protein